MKLTEYNEYYVCGWPIEQDWIVFKQKAKAKGSFMIGNDLRTKGVPHIGDMRICYETFPTEEARQRHKELKHKVYLADLTPENK
ncbi:MAG: hypothetical protein D6816_02415 [Bacteroidetes bacterium]|nr:MAG: hypothetical protein D6816_02415 [Bacteroidota bacterium]